MVTDKCFLTFLDFSCCDPCRSCLYILGPNIRKTTAIATERAPITVEYTIDTICAFFCTLLMSSCTRPIDSQKIPL